MTFTKILFLPFLLTFTVLLAQENGKPQSGTSEFISYTVDPQNAHLRLYWKDEKGNILGSIKNLKAFVERQKEHLAFAMNGGMYTADHSPKGLFVEDKKQRNPLDTASGQGNFYMKPHGVFYLTTDGKAGICKTGGFVNNNISYATQSGPMLIADGEINTAFKQGSENLNVRNGVGIMPDGKVVFVISKARVNFYDFADYFKSLGCENALYLDGFVSRMYLPEKGREQMDGDFGVMIGVTSPF
jgi:uncharacterized protein YigE (DUF2233 family)